jgi:hypothetical protein
MASKFASFILFLRRIVGLIFTPYVTMRKISLDTSWGELFFIFIFSLFYFFITNAVRYWLNGLIGAASLFGISIIFFSLMPAGQGTYTDRLVRIFRTWAYTLIPTLIWFYSTLLFYFLLPPPRTASVWGQLFSIFYIAFSASLLIWKLILVYLSIRFSLRVHLYRVIYYILIYLALSIPLWIFLYKAGISRIPFV